MTQVRLYVLDHGACLRYGAAELVLGYAERLCPAADLVVPIEVDAIARLRTGCIGIVMPAAFRQGDGVAPATAQGRPSRAHTAARRNSRARLPLDPYFD